MIACLAFWGCVQPTVAPAPVDPPKEAANPDVTPRAVRTGEGELVQKSEELRTLWTATYKSAEAAVNEQGRLSGTLFGVQGELYQGGKVASRFEATEAEADQGANTLVLQKNVTVRAEESKATLTADRVEWLESKGVIQATGNVTIEDGFGVLRSDSPMWVTPDLKHFGTPDMMQAVRS